MKVNICRYEHQSFHNDDGDDDDDCLINEKFANDKKWGGAYMKWSIHTELGFAKNKSL